MLNAFRQGLADALVFDWTKFDAMAALRCAAGVAVPLIVGVTMKNPSVGVFGAMGALSVGFGSFQEAPHGRVPAMFFSAAGMAIAVYVGAIAGPSAVAATFAAAAGGAASGLLAAVGPAASFVGLQAAIGLLIAVAFPPSSTWDAVVRAGLVMGGGLLQILLLFAAQPRTPVDPRAVTTKAVSSLYQLHGHAVRRTPALFHALRLAGAVGVSTAIYRWFDLPRGAWIPVTALLVLKPHLYETLARGFARMGGTVIGALVATAIMSALSPGEWLLVALISAFVWAGYALFRTNYGLFTICITCYVVLLIVLAGGAEPSAAIYRIVNTIIGGFIALAVAAIWPVADEVVPSRVDGGRPV